MTSIGLNELIEYTDWERKKWHDWLSQQGTQVLTIPLGPNGDDRFGTVGDVFRHVFSAERRYVDRLSGRPLTDTSSVPSDNIEVLFRLGEQARAELRNFVATFPAQDWDVMSDYKILNYALRANPRKIITHTLLHEIRHWAQIATVLRLNGRVAQFHDFLFSPVMGGEFELQQEPSSQSSSA